MQGRGILRRIRAGGLTLALFALTLKAMLPAGFMLGADASGKVAVTLCGGSGAELILDLHDDAPADQGGAQDCPFAFAAEPALPQLAAAIPAANPALVITAPVPLALTPAAPPTGPPLPARGPPLNA